MLVLGSLLLLCRLTLATPAYQVKDGKLALVDSAGITTKSLSFDSSSDSELATSSPFPVDSLSTLKISFSVSSDSGASLPPDQASLVFSVPREVVPSGQLVKDAAGSATLDDSSAARRSSGSISPVGASSNEVYDGPFSWTTPVKVKKTGKARYEIDMAQAPLELLLLPLASLPSQPGGGKKGWSSDNAAFLASTATIRVKLYISSKDVQATVLDLGTLRLATDLVESARTESIREISGSASKHWASEKYGVQPELGWTFRSKEKKVNAMLALVATLAVVGLPWSFLLFAIYKLSSQLKLSRPTPSILAFLASIAGFQVLTHLYWLRMTVVTVLPFVGGLGLMTIITGREALRDVRRLRSDDKKKLKKSLPSLETCGASHEPLVTSRSVSSLLAHPMEVNAFVTSDGIRHRKLGISPVTQLAERLFDRLSQSKVPQSLRLRSVILFATSGNVIPASLPIDELDGRLVGALRAPPSLVFVKSALNTRKLTEDINPDDAYKIDRLNPHDVIYLPWHLHKLAQAAQERRDAAGLSRILIFTLGAIIYELTHWYFVKIHGLGDKPVQGTASLAGKMSRFLKGVGSSDQPLEYKRNDAGAVAVEALIGHQYGFVGWIQSDAWPSDDEELVRQKSEQPVWTRSTVMTRETLRYLLGGTLPHNVTDLNKMKRRPKWVTRTLYGAHCQHTICDCPNVASTSSDPVSKPQSLRSNNSGSATPCRVSWCMAPHALYHCRCGQQDTKGKAPAASYELYFCEECDVVSCNNCCTFEPSCYYCPNCLFEVPAASVRGEKNRCARHCFECPQCITTLSVVAHDLGRSSAEPTYILVCSFCKWDSTEIDLIFDKPTGLAGQMQQAELDSPASQAFEHIRAHLEPYVRQGLSAQASASGTQATSAAHLSALTSLPARYATLLAGHVRARPSSKATGRDELADYSALQSHRSLCETTAPSQDRLNIELLRNATNLDNIAPVDRANTQNWQTSRASSSLMPARVPLRAKMSKRCRACRHILIRPEQKAQSLRYKIKLMAANYLPAIELRKRPSVTDEAKKTSALGDPSIDKSDRLLPGQRYTFEVSFANPLYEPISVSLAQADVTDDSAGPEPIRLTTAEPGFDYAGPGSKKPRNDRTRTQLSASSFDIAAFAELWEYDTEDIAKGAAPSSRSDGVQQRGNRSIVLLECAIDEHASGEIRIPLRVTYTYTMEEDANAMALDKAAQGGKHALSFWTTLVLGRAA
ncbi:uncharacterized protein L969DRAFT_93778 [Mixia osmundae IAM 14324]|uniref:uncharacterized protein n=1 Tax=Mixia osmundae (strain CBS 9802 / IAM 14324 / JCM 22182 / KY 12970) TaxID=764103 RepID=UPI0004A55729|nr:uncharacterized protein L969DRAFT_93778 [Mixia osmundae IAM 14324]KEI39948.1 hypothetical protein L969DRAFT_93778 [Mixia osmundae IAM 14324]